MNDLPPSLTDLNPRGALVYCVDADVTTRMAAESALRQAGIEVFGFSSAESALEAVAVRAADAVVLDVILPGQHGLEALRGILTTRPETSVVMASRVSDSDVIAEAMRCGAANFLVKPVHPKELVAAVRHAVDWTRLKRRINEIEARLEGAAAGQSDASPPKIATPYPECREPAILDLQTLEQRAIDQALRITAGNVSEAARRLGIGRTTLYRKMVSYGLEKAA